MRDFTLRNDTKLIYAHDIRSVLKDIAQDHKVLFVYGRGSVKKNGCYDDVREAVSAAGSFYEFSGASRELVRIRQGIEAVKKNNIDLIIGAGGASVMDCAKLIAFGVFHPADLWDYIGGGKSPRGLKKVPLALIPTYPSSGSECGLGAVAEDTENHRFGTAYGIAADTALLCPKYSLSLNAEMTAYSALVTLVQLSASTIGDASPISFDAGISVIRNVMKAAFTLQENPADEEARGTILLGASLSTSGRLGLGTLSRFAYDIYEVEFLPEMLFHASYRKSLTTIFPRFLKAMAAHHEADIRKFLKDAFGYEGSIASSCEKLVSLFASFGIDMYFDGEVTLEQVKALHADTELSAEECLNLLQECLRR